VKGSPCKLLWRLRRLSETLHVTRWKPWQGDCIGGWRGPMFGCHMAQSWAGTWQWENAQWGWATGNSKTKMGWLAPNHISATIISILVIYQTSQTILHQLYCCFSNLGENHLLGQTVGVGKPTPFYFKRRFHKGMGGDQAMWKVVPEHKKRCKGQSWLQTEGTKTEMYFLRGLEVPYSDRGVETIIFG